MKFHVKFVSKPMYACDKDSMSFGISLLKSKILAHVEVDPIRVENFIDNLKEDPQIELPYAVAEKTGLFQKATSEKVEVPGGFLNQFVFLERGIERGENEEILSIKLYYKVDYAAILQAWEDANFPLEWGFENQGEDDDVDEDE
jgi:hypothetical protein